MLLSFERIIVAASAGRRSRRRRRRRHSHRYQLLSALLDHIQILASPLYHFRHAGEKRRHSIDTQHIAIIPVRFLFGWFAALHLTFLDHELPMRIDDHAFHDPQFERSQPRPSGRLEQMPHDLLSGLVTNRAAHLTMEHRQHGRSAQPLLLDQLDRLRHHDQRSFRRTEHVQQLRQPQRMAAGKRLRLQQHNRSLIVQQQASHGCGQGMQNLTTAATARSQPADAVIVVAIFHAKIVDDRVVHTQRQHSRNLLTHRTVDLVGYAEIAPNTEATDGH